MSKPRQPNRKLVVKKEDEIPELLSGVSRYLGEKAGEIGKALETMQSWDSYLLGFGAGLLTGLRVAEDIIGIMSDRAMAGEGPFPSEPYPLNGFSNIL